MKAIIKYVHAISSCAKDISEPYEINSDNLATATAARRWIKNHSGTSVPLAGARRTDDGGWIFFPMRKHGSIWWSVAIRLDVKEVHKEAALCKCRNHA